MSSVVAIVPCYRAQSSVLEVIDGIKSVIYEGERPSVVAVIDGRTDNTLEVLREYQKEQGTPEVILSYEKNRGKTGAMRVGYHYLLGLDPEADISESREIKKGKIVTYIDSDGQQRYPELFARIGIPVLTEGYDFGHIERRKPIQMPQERIILEICENRIALGALNRMGYDTTSLGQYNTNLGPGGGIRDLQNSIFFRWRGLEDVGTHLFGERYSFELEVFLRAVVNNCSISWGERTDYGRPAELTGDWITTWQSYTREKMNVLQRHTGIIEEELRIIIEDVLAGIESEEYIRRIFDGL